MRRFLVVLALAAIVMLLEMDPYSWGAEGGDCCGMTYPWQWATTGIDMIALGAVVVAVLLGRWSYAKYALLLELFFFLSVNAAYIVRDGAGRFVVGYESSPKYLPIVLGGLVMRVLTLRALWRGGGRSLAAK